LFAIAFVLIYFGGLFRAVTSNPIWGLYIYVFAFYLHPPARWWGQSLPDLRWSLTAAAITLLAILIRKGYKINGFQFKETKLLICFSIYVCIQSLWVDNLTIHLEYVNLVVKFVILIILMHSCVKNKSDVMGFILINLVGCLYYAYLGETRTSGGRLDGIGGPSIASSNQLGQHLAAVMFFCGFAIFTHIRSKWQYFFMIAGVGLTLKVIIMTGSRGVFLGVGVVGLLALFSVPKEIKKKVYTYFALACAAAAVSIGPTLIERFEGIQVDEATGEVSDTSARSRIYILEAQWEMFKAAPILGHGHRATLLLSPYYIASEYRSGRSGNGGYRASHNLIASLFIDHGVIGATLYLSVIYLCLKRIWAFSNLNRREEKQVDREISDLKVLGLGFCFGLLSLIITGMTSNNKTAETDWWLYALIPICSRLISEKEQKNDK
jgi:O-antigen ligase